ncbi:hypothetical protein SAMN06295912_112109 [Sphingomonas laterariae]|uniref:Uncharacterized protein n=1 Tax=Edaphosphingomonas laterariae TaxID=861865 RepID=A0A239GJ81_9SPHN|nr:hypothetical protein [Sphingomonas laterariae]SNS69356.1 hypothetical protein SAMN06295912_112109 [Sphingomonas laterariae]
MRLLRRLLDRLTDRRPTIRPSRSRRRPWWRRSARPWLLLGLLVGLCAAIALLLAQHSPAKALPAALSTAWTPGGFTAPDDHPDSP